MEIITGKDRKIRAQIKDGWWSINTRPIEKTGLETFTTV